MNGTGTKRLYKSAYTKPACVVNDNIVQAVYGFLQTTTVTALCLVPHDLDRRTKEPAVRFWSAAIHRRFLGVSSNRWPTSSFTRTPALQAFLLAPKAAMNRRTPKIHAYRGFGVRVQILTSLS